MSLTDLDPPRLRSDSNLARNVGPNVVVVYEPGSVEDLCLLWDLRASHALPKGFPLAVPVTVASEAALDFWMAERAVTLWQMRSPRPTLVSCSISRDRLDAISQRAKDDWGVADPGEVLQNIVPPGRVSSDVVTFSDGRASAPGWSADDRRLVIPHAPPLDWFDLRVRFRPQTQVLPRSVDLEKYSATMGGPRGGFWEAQASRPDGVVGVEWPAGWTVLSSLAKDRGMRIEPSVAGRRAAALLRRLGTLDHLRPLLSDVVLQRLQRLCEREGMTWFRQKLRDMGAKAKTSSGDIDLKVLVAEVNTLHIPAIPSENQHYLTYSQLRNDFDSRDSTSAWLKWAEGAGLLVRGVEVSCGACGAESWRAIGEVSPPVVCRGCGSIIEDPFPADRLDFKYRASEVLVQATSGDTLSHLLAMRFFCELYRTHSDHPSSFYGGYPGVEFYDLDSGKHIGEADVVLAFSSGELVLGECKRTGHGLTNDELAKLDRLADRLASEWTFVATPAWAADCDGIWREAARALPDNPRFCLTGERLLRDDLTFAYGDDPFAFVEFSEEERRQRQDEFLGRCPKLLNWLRGPRGWEAWHASD
jgi:hypothetical protein